MAMKSVAWLLGVGACLCATLAPAQDDPSASAQNHFASFHQAHDEITGRLSRDPPSLQDPAYAAQVARAFDLSLLTEEIPVLNLMGICFRASATQAAYLLRGAKKEDFDPWAIQPRLKSGARAAKLKNENYMRFQDELVAALRFGVACRALELQNLEIYLDRMPPAEMTVFRLSFSDFQQGLAEVVSYHAEALAQPIRPENRQAVLDLLVQNIDPLATGMTRQTRKTAAAGLAKLLAASSPDVRAKLQKVELALKRSDCGRVCAFQ